MDLYCGIAREKLGMNQTENDKCKVPGRAYSKKRDSTHVEVSKAMSRSVKKAKKEQVDTKPMKSLSKAVDTSLNASSKSSFTDDGFRIVSHIPDDDSDLSDAFDIDGSNCEEEAETLSPSNTSPKELIPKSTKPSSEIKISVKDEVAVKGAEGEGKKKKHKRGARKKNKTGANNILPNPIEKSKKKDKDKKNRKPKKPIVVLTEEDIEAIKSRINPKVQKIIKEFGLDWANFDTPELREQRELAKLPQPEQIPNCASYLMRDKRSGKIITVRDYSKKRGGSQAGTAPSTRPGASNDFKNAAVTAVKGMKQPGGVTKAAPTVVSKANKNVKPGQQPLTQEQLDLIEKKKQMKAEHLEELRAIKRNIVDNVINKSLDPRTREQKQMAVIEKLGGVVKKPYINYKVLMANKKREKEEAEAARENLKNLGMHDLVKKKRRERRRKDPNEVGGFNSLGGRIRDGVMVIRKRDIAKMSS